MCKLTPGPGTQGGGGVAGGGLRDSYGFTAFHCGGGSLGQHLSPDLRKIIKICSRLYTKHTYFRAYHDVITKGFKSIVLEGVHFMGPKVAKNGQEWPIMAKNGLEI